MVTEVKITFSTKNITDTDRLILMTKLIEVLNTKGVDDLIIVDSYQYSKETIQLMMDATKITE